MRLRSGSTKSNAANTIAKSSEPKKEKPAAKAAGKAKSKAKALDAAPLELPSDDEALTEVINKYGDDFLEKIPPQQISNRITKVTGRKCAATKKNSTILYGKLRRALRMVSI